MASTNRAEHIISGSKLNPVYLDSGSNLNKDQINTINTILFNNYRRFRRSVNTVEEDEPVTLKNFTSFSKSIQNVFDKSYGDVHTISFLMMVKDLKKKGMKYLGPITMYSYLQTIGVINSHEEDCFLY